MKRYLQKFILILPLIFLSACISTKAMQVVYTVRSSETLKNYVVYLVVNDKRTTSDMVGAEAKTQGLFKELKNGIFDLQVDMPNGSKIIMTNMSTIGAVREAANRKLASQGVPTTDIKAAAQLTVEINIDEMNINLVDGELVATVALSSDIYRDPSAVANSSARTVSNRMKLIGGTGGATVLSDSLSQVMNDLDLSGINNF